jgi:hypothetical protein
MLIRILAVFAFLVCATPAFAADETAIGSIMAIEGTVTIQRAGAEKAEDAAAAMPVYLNDTIETGPGARAITVFEDETKLVLGENAMTTVDEYIFAPAAASGNRARLSVVRGAFLYVSGLIGKQARPDVEIKIPYGSIGLRGTTVWGGDLDQYGVFVLDGKVSVQTKRGSVILAKGEGVDLASDKAAPSGRKVWGEAKIGRAVATVTLKKQEEADKRVEAELERLRAENAKTAPAPKDDKNAPKAPVNPGMKAPEPATPPATETAPEKKSDSGFGDDDGAQQVQKARSALEDRKEELTAPAPVPAPAAPKTP